MGQPQAKLICGTVRLADAGEAKCSVCHAAIYPTLGSLSHAQANGVEMICVDCFSLESDWAFGGMMHHGQMVPLTDDQATRMLAAIENDARTRRKKVN